ncbi:hypothetical protein WJX84_011996 [Apatococcus fuscideae]|uniref:Uncharacterized protein n=1 Tax=Apatococcus fuscideae TaxID=2026836 RepID=A0AAW1SVM9_9CHLO
MALASTKHDWLMHDVSQYLLLVIAWHPSACAPIDAALLPEIRCPINPPDSKRRLSWTPEVRWGRLSQAAVAQAGSLEGPPATHFPEEPTAVGAHPISTPVAALPPTHLEEGHGEDAAGKQAHPVSPFVGITIHPTLAPSLGPSPLAHRYSVGCDDSPVASPVPAESASSMGDSMLLSPSLMGTQQAESGFTVGNASPSHPPTAGSPHFGRGTASTVEGPAIARSGSKLSEASTGNSSRMRALPPEASMSQSRRDPSRRASIEVSRRPTAGGPASPTLGLSPGGNQREGPVPEPNEGPAGAAGKPKKSGWRGFGNARK